MRASDKGNNIKKRPKSKRGQLIVMVKEDSNVEELFRKVDTVGQSLRRQGENNLRLKHLEISCVATNKYISSNSFVCTQIIRTCFR